MLRIPPFLAPIRIDASRVEVLSRSPLQAITAKGFIVFRAPHKIITDNARRNIKLPVIQQVGSMPNNIKSDFTCRNVSMFVVEFHPTRVNYRFDPFLLWLLIRDRISFLLVRLKISVLIIFLGIWRCHTGREIYLR